MVSDNPQDLFAQTGALRDEERLLLQLAAIIYEPVSTSFLCRAYMALHQFFLGERRVRPVPCSPSTYSTPMPIT